MQSSQTAVVIVCHDLGRTLAQAVDSVLDQTRPVAEHIIIDDGSTDVATHQSLCRLEERGHRVIRTEPSGISAARNLGARATRAPCLVFLDADDVLDRRYLEKTAGHLESRPELDFVSTAMRGFEGASYVWAPPQPWLPRSIAYGVVHASTLMRRRVWESVGGFDEALEAFEELDFWTTVMERGFRGEVLEEPLLNYRVRPGSMYRRAIRGESYNRLLERYYRKHWDTILAITEELLVEKEAFIQNQAAHHAALARRESELSEELASLGGRIEQLTAALQQAGGGRVDWGELRRTTPLSPVWGVDRGRPVDRHYIESFLAQHADDVRGRVLEIKDSGYARAFGCHRVESIDVLDIDASNAEATINTDLCRADTIPTDTYDCFILTQTLNIVRDVEAALAHAHRVLRPGGVLLCTVSAVNRVSYEDRGLDGDYWRFTEASMRELFARFFPPEAFDVTTFGNVLACAGLLYGVAAEELTDEELARHDPYFPLVCAVRAVKLDATASRRPRAASVCRAGLDRGAAVLMYHRIASATPDPHRLCVTPEHFRAHMEHLARHYQPMSLLDVAAAAAAGKLPERAVAVTIDDGYVDALTAAAPILSELSVPATVFAVTGALDAQEELWWDVLARILLTAPRLPEHLELSIGGEQVLLATRSEGERAVAHARLVDAVQPLGRQERDAVVAQLVAWSGLSQEPRLHHRVLDTAQLRELASVPGVTLGAHTESHLFLPRQEPAVQRLEIESSRRRLEEIVQGRVRAFAYPFGAQSPAVVRLVREAGFEVAVTVEAAPVRQGLLALLTPRYEVVDCDAATFACRLREISQSCNLTYTDAALAIAGAREALSCT